MDTGGETGEGRAGRKIQLTRFLTWEDVGRKARPTSDQPAPCWVGRASCPTVSSWIGARKSTGSATWKTQLTRFLTWEDVGRKARPTLRRRHFTVGRALCPTVSSLIGARKSTGRARKLLSDPRRTRRDRAAHLEGHGLPGAGSRPPRQSGACSHRTMGEHRFGYFGEAGDVAAFDVVHPLFITAVGDAALVDAFHDLLEAAIDFFAGPREAR